MKTIYNLTTDNLVEPVSVLNSARCVAALTGAGISVGSGIPDFRSAGGLWTKFSPEEYATLDVFLQDPEKSWGLYRELGRNLTGKKPNKAHFALAELEEMGYLKGLVTQNIDSLHQVAGNRYVFEIHGNHQHLHCLECGYLEPVEQAHFTSPDIPTCSGCNFPLKPNIVLFGEAVRQLDEIHFFIGTCDLLLVVGTSARVYPAAGLPGMVKANGGKVFEFNKEPALGGDTTDYLFKGDLLNTLPALSEAVRQQLHS